MKTNPFVQSAIPPGVRLAALLFLSFWTYPATPATDLDPVLVGQYPPYGEGSVQAIAISSDHAYVAFGEAGLQILDIRDPANPRRVGAYDVPHSSVDGVAVQGSYAYVLLDTVPGLQVLDVSNPAQPHKVSEYRTQASDSSYARPNDIAVSGDLCFSVGSLLEIIDISTSTNPQRLGLCAIEKGGQSLVVSGGHAYVVDASAGLEVFDISDAANPRSIGRHSGSTTLVGPGDVAVSDDIAYVLGAGELWLIDVSDPAHPQRLGGCSAGTAGGVAVSRAHAYVASWEAGLTVIDVSDPTTPRLVGSFDSSGRLSALALSDHYAYIGDWAAGVPVIDISSPGNPQLAGEYRYPHLGVNGPSGLAMSGNYAYVAGAGSLYTINIADPAAPWNTGQYMTDGYITRVRATDNFAHILGDWWDEENHRMWSRYEIVDASNPASPQRVGYYDLDDAECCYGGLAVAGSYAYVTTLRQDGTNWVGRLQVLDVSNPATPHPTGELSMPGVWDVAVSGQYACVLAGTQDGPSWAVSLGVIDVSDPANPHRVGGCTPPAPLVGLAMSGHYAYVVAKDGSELVVIDISNPESPQTIGACPLEGVCTFCNEVTVSGRYVCVAADHGGVLVLDVSEPTRPRRVGRWTTHGQASGVAIFGRHVAVADGSWEVDGGRYPAGLVILDLEHPASPERLGSVEVPRGALDLAVSGHYSYATSQYWENDASGGQSGMPPIFHVIDSSDPTHPQPLGECATYEETGGKPIWVAVSYPYAIVEGYFLGVGVIDVSDSAHPRKVREIGTGGNIERLVMAGDYAYAAGWREQLARFQIFDARGLPDLQQVGLIELPGQGAGLAVSEDYAYMAGENLEVIDISQPANPRRVGGCPGLGGGWDGRVAVADGLLYVLGEGLLRVFKITEPTNPQMVGECSASGGDIAVTGDYAYVAASGAGVEVFNVSDHAHPRRVGGNSSFDANALAIADGRLHVAAGEQGLVILDLYHPPLRLESLSLGRDGFQLLLRGETGQIVRLERSRDLLNWEPVATVPIPANGQTLIDPAACTEPCLFYRVVSVP